MLLTEFDVQKKYVSSENEYFSSILATDPHISNYPVHTNISIFSVMLGKKGGVGPKLEIALGRKLYKTHCGAHRFELVVKNGFKKVPNYDLFESDVNAFANYYGHQNHKKWNNLIEYEELQVGFYSFCSSET